MSGGTGAGGAGPPGTAGPAPDPLTARLNAEGYRRWLKVGLALEAFTTSPGVHAFMWDKGDTFHRANLLQDCKPGKHVNWHGYTTTKPGGPPVQKKDCHRCVAKNCHPSSVTSVASSSCFGGGRSVPGTLAGVRSSRTITFTRTPPVTGDPALVIHPASGTLIRLC
jgi:hypothetical protein